MNVSMRPVASALVFFAAAVSSIAQTNSSAVTELSLERQLALATTLSSADLAFPADKAQGIVSGALEVRERLIYNPSGATLTSTIFVVQSGSPLPTPINTNLTGMILGVYTLNVEKIYATTKPSNALGLAGTIAGGTNGGVLGDVNGSPFYVSMGYSNDTPAKVTDLVNLVPGRVVAYSKTAAGTLVVPKPPAPPTGGEGPQLVILAPPNTVDRQINLDASKTTDASGTTLTFAWRAVGKTAVVLNPNTATPTIQFSEGSGDYAFELTVTNGKGQSAKKTVIVTYFGR